MLGGVFVRFAVDVGDGAAELCRLFVGLAADDAVGEVVAAAVLQLSQNVAQVGGVAADGGAGGVRQRQVAPVRPEVCYRRPGDAAADEGVEQAARHGFVQLHQPRERERGQRLHGDEEGGEAVFAVAEVEEAGGADDDEPQFGGHCRGEVRRDAGGDDAEQGAKHALVHPAFGGGVVRLADEDGGEQYPVAQFELERGDDEAAGENDEGEAHRVAVHRRGEGELAAQYGPKRGECRVFLRGDGAVLVVRVGVIAVEVGELVVDAAQVVEQAL